MAATPAILDLVSIDFLNNAWIDWSDILVAHLACLGYLEVPYDDQCRCSSNMATTAAFLDLVSVDLSDERLCGLVRFFGASLGGHQSSPCSSSP
jgi:hypothetical protein